MRKLCEVLTNETQSLNQDLRRAFRPLSPHIDITDDATLAMITLINLTNPIDKQNDLFCTSAAKAKLKDETWWSSCLKAAAFRHSHNVKFPDIRATGTIRAQPIEHLPCFLLSSNKVEPIDWCYSKNSNQVNIATFLTSEFSWRDKISCLALLLKDIDHPLWNVLSKLGCTKKTQKDVIKVLSQLPELTIDSELVFNYLRQMSFPDGNGSYITLSPVTSQALQSKFYQALEGEFPLVGIMRFSRATSMGVLPMTCAGAFRLIKSFPTIKKNKHHYLNNEKAWRSREVIKAYQQYLDTAKWLLTKNKRVSKLENVTSLVKSALISWVRDTNPIDKSPSTLTKMFNLELSSSPYTSRFAYDLKLTKLCIQLFEQLEDLPEEKNATKSNESNNNSLLLPCLKLRSVSALNSPYSLGLPSMMAFFGFIHAFERKIRSVYSEFKVNSFAICVHNYHLSKRGLTKEATLKSNGDILPPATYDNWQCDAEVSLILDCDSNIHISSSEIYKLLPRRLARGLVKLPISQIPSLRFYSSPLEAIKAIKSHNGQWMTLNYQKELNCVEAILESLKSDRSFYLNCIGYHLLEEPNDKEHSLRNYPHAFAESILAVIKGKTISFQTNIDEIFWVYSYQNHGPILLTRSYYGSSNSAGLPTLD